VRVVTIVPHTGSWELRAGLLHANISRTGAQAGVWDVSGMGYYPPARWLARQQKKCRETFQPGALLETLG
jgi:hypothetical protein